MTRRSARILAGVVAVCGVALATSLGVATPASAGTVLGTEYEHENYAGASINVVHPNNGFICPIPVNNRDWGVPSLIAKYGSYWNDRITSFTVYSGCLSRHWEHLNYVGHYHDWSGDTANIGTYLNDLTSSVEFS